MKRLQQSGERKIHRIQHLCRIDESLTEKTSYTISEKLRREGDKDTSSLVGVTTIVESLSGESLCRKSRDGTGRSAQCDGSVLLHVEGTRVEESADGTDARDGESHQLAEDVCNDTQENNGDENGLRLEVEDFL